MCPITDNMTKQEVIEELAKVLAKIIRRELAKKNQNQKGKRKRKNLIKPKKSGFQIKRKNMDGD